MSDPEKKAVVFEVADWIWGTIQGGFNEQQSISQIIVDAVIGMIPVVGDVTAARDLIAVILRLVDDPKKREDWLEWMTLVVLVFALIPVAGGAIKGVGKLLIKAGEDAAALSKAINEIIHFLNRIGQGNAIKFLKQLDLSAYLPQIQGKWRYLTQVLQNTLSGIIKKAGTILPDGMIRRMEQLRTQIGELAKLGDRMIPDALKELNRRLKVVQQKLYSGDWHEIPASLKSATREAEARLLPANSKGEKLWTVENPDFPQNPPSAFKKRAGWPELAPNDVKTFSGSIKAVKLPPKTRIYRVLDPSSPYSKAEGKFWAYELPANGRRWREDYAVLEDWSKNGTYVVYEVPAEGLVVWEGKAASQIDKKSGQYLKGGRTQLVIDFNFSANKHALGEVSKLKQHRTNWTDVMGVNIPKAGVTVQRLGHNEIETKKNVVVGRSAATGAQSNKKKKDSPSARK